MEKRKNEMTVTIQHVMDQEKRTLPLDEAFLEALALSEGRASAIEEQENDLYEYLKKYPSFIHHITDEYKLEVIRGWDYEIHSFIK